MPCLDQYAEQYGYDYSLLKKHKYLSRRRSLRKAACLRSIDGVASIDTSDFLGFGMGAIGCLIKYLELYEHIVFDDRGKY